MNMIASASLREAPQDVGTWARALCKKILGKKRYDLPLHRGSGGILLSWTIGVMTYLVCLFMVMVFALAAMQGHWQQGLEGRYTVEIPYEIAQKSEQNAMIDRLVTSLNTLRGVNAKRLDDTAMADLVEPWLGHRDMVKELPLPVLISVERLPVKDEKSVATIDTIQAMVDDHIPEARLDTHQEWLSEWLKLTQVGRMIVLLIAFILAMTAALTVAATAKTRLALHKDEVDLLHLIGATDHYIAGQFQRQAFRIAAEGAAAGMVCAFLTLGILSLIKGQTPSQLLPHFSMNWLQWIFLLLTPLLAGVIAMVSSRFTVVNALEDLP
jgi:cell division transport system permease protein